MITLNIDINYHIYSTSVFFMQIHTSHTCVSQCSWYNQFIHDISFMLWDGGDVVFTVHRDLTVLGQHHIHGVVFETFDIYSKWNFYILVLKLPFDPVVIANTYSVYLNPAKLFPAKMYFIAFWLQISQSEQVNKLLPKRMAFILHNVEGPLILKPRCILIIWYLVTGNLVPLTNIRMEHRSVNHSYI